MSSFHNNNLVHNLRACIEMVEGKMRPSVVSAAFKAEGINMPTELIEAVSQPGVLESICAKPITHAVVKNNIKVYNEVFIPLAAQCQAQNEDDEKLTVEFHEDDTE